MVPPVCARASGRDLVSGFIQGAKDDQGIHSELGRLLPLDNTTYEVGLRNPVGDPAGVDVDGRGTAILSFVGAAGGFGNIIFSIRVPNAHAA